VSGRCGVGLVLDGLVLVRAGAGPGRRHARAYGEARRRYRQLTSP